MVGRQDKGGTYWYVSMDIEGVKIQVYRGHDYHHDMDDKRYATGNYFDDPDEALKFAGSINLALKARLRLPEVSDKMRMQVRHCERYTKDKFEGDINNYKQVKEYIDGHLDMAEAAVERMRRRSDEFWDQWIKD